MKEKKSRVIFDTNILISFLINNDFSKINHLIFSNKIKLIFSEELLEEFLEVCQRPKFSKYFNNKNLSELLEMLLLNGEIVSVKSKLEVCRDKKDDFLLNLAKDSKANFLITGDKDLLDLKQIEKTTICTFKYFIDIF